jgi:single-stranded-DNA-specific exonuclease
VRWKLKPFPAAQAAELTKELGLYSIVAGVLAARGLGTVEEARRFINPSLASDWTNPADIADMDVIALRLKEAVLAHQNICIFGDYDVDGITASAIMANVLTALGSRPQVVLPLRRGEGYGLSDAVLERIYAIKPDVLLTVDCGVSGAHEVAQLRQHGIEVLITDHHEASGMLPVDVPIADPKLNEDNPAAILAGAGVALKLATLLGAHFDQPELWKTQLDLAALGTIADCMPLTGENRSLVRAGIRMIHSQPRPGIIAAHDVSGQNVAALSSEALSYGLIPRLNAAGRISDPLIAFDLLSTQNPSRARDLASKLEALNKERKDLESALFAEAVEQIEPFSAESRVLIVGGECWHDGVKGIVAGRLARHYGVPALVFSFEDGLAIGSGRTVGSIDLHAAVSELSDMFVRFGGHKAAVGLTVERDRVSEFAARLDAIMQQIPSEQFDAADEIDCQIGLEQLSLAAIDELSILEPYGSENPEPKFLSRDLLLKSTRFVGVGEQHIALAVSDGVRELQAIWFNAPYRRLEDLPARADLVYRVRVDEWKGRRTKKLYLVDALTDTTPLKATGEGAVGETGRLDASVSTSPDQQLASALQGNAVTLRAAQAKCLETLARRQSTLAIMATGRGKSLIFHTHAAKLAQRQQGPSLFIYPLRSLISDQEYFLTGALGRLGLACASLTGSTAGPERERIVQGVVEGSINVVLSTPEFVLANASRYGFWRDFAFIVIDEAHHIATSGERFRPGYTQLERLRSLAPGAVFLGLSATSDKATTDAIAQSLSIDQIVVDTSRRPNLTLVDKRDIPDREAYLARVVAQGSKSLVYASSRATTIKLCKALRKELREQAERIAFYNAALTAEDRRAVETAFRDGSLSCLVATSAFGEGVNIPDVRDVVLYDLPYSIIDFNQMAGRAGRDGQESFVHVLAQSSDAAWIAEHLKGEAEEAEGSVPAEADECAEDERQAAVRHLELFADWLFKTGPDGLSSVIQRPLTPLDELRIQGAEEQDEI